MLISTNGVKWVSPHTTRTVTDGTDYSSDLIQYAGDVCFRVHPYDDGAFIQMTDCGIHWSNCSYIDRYEKWCDTIAWNGYEYILYPKRMSKNSPVYSSIDGRVWKRALTYEVIDRTLKDIRGIVVYGGSHMLDIDDVIHVGKLNGGELRPVRSENMKDSRIPALHWSAVCYSEQMNSFVLACNEVCGHTIKIATIEVTGRDYPLRFRMKSPECLRLTSVQSMCNISDTIAMIANGGRKVVVGNIMTNKWLPVFNDDGRDVGDDFYDGDDMNEVSNEVAIEQRGGRVYDERSLIVGIIISVVIGMLIGYIVDGTIEVVIDVVLKVLMIRPL